MSPDSDRADPGRSGGLPSASGAAVTLDSGGESGETDSSIMLISAVF